MKLTKFVKVFANGHGEIFPKVDFLKFSLHGQGKTQHQEKQKN